MKSNDLWKSACGAVIIVAVSQTNSIAADVETRASYNFSVELGGVIRDDCTNWPGILQGGGSVTGGVLRLDGLDDYVSIAPEALNDLPIGSVEAWIFVESLDVFGGAPIFSKGTADLTDLSLGVGADGRVSGHIATGPSVTSTSTVPLLRWTKVALTWDGGTRRIYINDVLEGELLSANVPPNNNVNEVKIGRHNHPFGPLWFHGAIDRVLISTVARTFKPLNVSVRVSHVEICWNSLADTSYQVEYRSELTSNTWNPLGPVVVGNGSTNCVIDAVISGEPAKYYRIQGFPTN